MDYKGDTVAFSDNQAVLNDLKDCFGR